MTPEPRPPSRCGCRSAGPRPKLAQEAAAARPRRRAGPRPAPSAPSGWSRWTARPWPRGRRSRCSPAPGPRPGVEWTASKPPAWTAALPVQGPRPSKPPVRSRARRGRARDEQRGASEDAPARSSSTFLYPPASRDRRPGRARARGASQRVDATAALPRPFREHYKACQEAGSSRRKIEPRPAADSHGGIARRGRGRWRAPGSGRGPGRARRGSGRRGRGGPRSAAGPRARSPAPSSAHSRTTRPPSRRARGATRARRRGVYFTALSARLARAWRSRVRSPGTVSPAGASTARVTPFSSAASS